MSHFEMFIIYIMVAPHAVNGDYYTEVNSDDENTWYPSSTLSNDYYEAQWDRLNSDVSDQAKGAFTYNQVNIGNKTIGYYYPCTRRDNSPTSYWSGNNSFV